MFAKKKKTQKNKQTDKKSIQKQTKAVWKSTENLSS